MDKRPTDTTGRNERDTDIHSSIVVDTKTIVKDAFNYRWVILSLAVLAQISFSTAQQCVAPLAPFIQTDLQLSLAQIGLFSSSMYLGTAFMLVFTGWLVDCIGIRYMLLAGQLILGVMIGAVSLTQSLWQVLLLLFLSGIGMSASGPTTTKAVVTWFPVIGRATAMGVKQTGMPIAGIFTAMALPVLSLAIGWRLSFAVAGCAIIVIGLFCFFFYREADCTNGQRITFANSMQAARQTLLNRDILTLSIAAALLMAVQFTLIAYLVLYLHNDLSFTVITAGVYLAIAQVGGIVGRLGWGVVSDRLFHGQRKGVLVFTGYITMVLSLLMAFVSQQMDAISLGVLVFLLGIAIIGWPGLHLSMISELAGTERTGTAVGLSLTICYIGMAIGPPMFGLIVDSTFSYGPAWVFLTVLTLIGIGFLHLTHEGQHLD